MDKDNLVPLLKRVRRSLLEKLKKGKGIGPVSSIGRV
jgi:hypothetical protein